MSLSVSSVDISSDVAEDENESRRGALNFARLCRFHLVHRANTVARILVLCAILWQQSYPCCIDLFVQGTDYRFLCWWSFHQRLVDRDANNRGIKLGVTLELVEVLKLSAFIKVSSYTHFFLFCAVLGRRAVPGEIF